ncbi:MAG: class II glutamine amidotransferase [Myxococcota bacterium]|nr:class II glutamine amidotransferase [Myxococcota bacterium]
MPNLLAMSFEGELAPSFDLRCLRSGDTLPDGWGLGYYPAGEPSASVLKEPAPPRGSIRGELVKAWEHLESSLFVLHVRTATWGPNTDANTQPFVRSWGGREWMIGHAGSLSRTLEPGTDPRFEPVGATDTERVFCVLLERIASRGWRSLADSDIAVIHGWLMDLNGYGSLDLVLCDGGHLLAYADRFGPNTLHLGELLPPYADLVIGDADVRIDLTSRGKTGRKGVLIASEPLRSEGTALFSSWRPLRNGEIVLVRQGAIVGGAVTNVPKPEVGKEAAQLPASRARRRQTAVTTPTRLAVFHRTSYSYLHAVERSTHLLRLVPAHDRLQTVLESEVTVSVPGRWRDFDDVFANRARRVDIDTPYRELSIVSRSKVELLDTDPLGFGLRRTRTTIPLVWMPWQRAMLEPFLLPPELPESQLDELVDYAMRFVMRNDGDLLDTLLDLNDAIHREYVYAQGATTLSTSAFDVYAAKRGVCQDFANLFICLARLMSIPARYVCGYLLTAPKDPNSRQAEASHAWVQVYLPEVGWRGLDPTNGVVTHTRHVRVAVGRNYIDATPTSGTIYVGGSSEALDVEVRVEVAT